MNKKTVLHSAVEGVVGSVVDVPLVNQFDAVMALQLDDITKSAEMLVAIERWTDDIKSTSAGVAGLVYGVLISQGERDVVTYAWWDLVGIQWKAQYNIARGGGLADNALDVAWSRACALVFEEYGLTKPKAETADAKKKAEQREVKAKELKELVASYEAVPIDDIKSEIKALFNVVADGGDAGKVAKIEADKLVKVVEQLTKSESEELKVEQKAVKDKIKELLKNVSDIYVLRDVMDMLQGAVYDTENLL